MPTRRIVLFSCVVAVVLALAALATAPYLLPTAIALGPCGRDWTSPSSYIRRVSPTLSLRWSVGGADAKICYGSPRARGREIFGGLVPWGELWRTGANEPTRIFTDRPLDVAGIPIGAGRYSLYTIPDPDRWRIFISSSTFHWGNAISPEVRARELGSGEVDATTLAGNPVESLTFRWQPVDARSGNLVLEWQSTRVEIPVAAGGTGI